MAKLPAGPTRLRANLATGMSLKEATAKALGGAPSSRAREPEDENEEEDRALGMDKEEKEERRK